MENEQKKTGKEVPDVLTINQAAKEAGITPAAVRNAIYAGKLNKTEMLERIVIDREEFNRWRQTAQTAQGGRPKGAKNKPKTYEGDPDGETQH